MGRPEDGLWNFVRKEPNNKWQCAYCERKFKGSVTRVRAHLLGTQGQGIAACTGEVPDDVKREASGINIGSTSDTQEAENEMPLPDKDLAKGLGNANTTSENMHKLSKELKRLICQSEDVEEQLNCVESQKGKKRRRQVDNWLSEVDSIKKRVEDIKTFVDQNMEGKIQKLIEEVAELIKIKPREEFLTLDVPVIECVQQPLLVTHQLVGQNFQSNINKTWELLNDENVKIIGVHGMGGAGKTTLVARIHDDIANGVNIFSSVFWVTVSQYFSITKLQHAIAKRINLILDEECEEQMRAARLRQALKEKKRLLLILDDVWNKIDLNRIGIPLEKGGIKLILTTRSLEVCR